MEFRPDQLLEKTPQGVNATRSGEGLSSQAHKVLKSFDGAKPVSTVAQACGAASIADAAFAAALAELKKIDYLRVLDAAAATAEAERKMMLTLDFTSVPASKPAPKPADKPVPSPARPAVTPASRTSPPSSGSGPAPVRVAQAPAALQMPQPADSDEDSRVEKVARLKREIEVRQKLMVALQPRVEEELRARLRPKLEQELRPKLIAALRPGVEAEMRTALIRELTPRVELELKARFAKTLAAQKAAEPRKVVEPGIEPVAAPVVAPAVDTTFERVLASMNVPVFSVDKTGVCSYMSPAWAQFSGYTPAETLGKALVDFFAAPNQRAILALLTGIAAGTALRFEQQGALLREGSEPLWVEISAAPLYSSSGEPIGVCGSIRDAEESRRTAEQAEADGVRLLLLVDQIDTGVMLEDGDGNIQQANPALCTLLALDSAPYSLEGMAVTDLLQRASSGFIGPDGFLHRVAEIRAAGEDSKAESFVMTDGRVIEQDYLAVSVGDNTVGRLWLYREMARPKARPAS